MKRLNRVVELTQRAAFGLKLVLLVCTVFGLVVANETASKTGVLATAPESTANPTAGAPAPVNFERADLPADEQVQPQVDYWTMLFVFVLATFIGLGVVARVSRLLHTPLMSLTNAISAIAVVGSILVTGADYPMEIRMLGAIALFASMTNIVSGFLITDRMLKMFKPAREEKKT
ncbi:MAG: NAD(P) transhydrogenase subunit alpha [bacterium]